jgi:F-type H+-transporting ATPase subunit epsilon
MNLKISLPFKILVEETSVLSIVAETKDGSIGLLPNRLDCVAALVPGILIYQTEHEGEKLLAVDEGILVKTGSDVSVSVRRALVGADLAQLRQMVQQEYLTLDEEEQTMRSIMAKLESGFLHRFASFEKK